MIRLTNEEILLLCAEMADGFEVSERKVIYFKYDNQECLCGSMMAGFENKVLYPTLLDRAVQAINENVDGYYIEDTGFHINVKSTQNIHSWEVFEYPVELAREAAIKYCLKALRNDK
jgi:hypothetical protein